MAQLKKRDGTLSETDLEAARILNEFFHSVLIEEGDFVDVDENRFDQPVKLEDVQFPVEKVLDTLRKLKPEKAQGPDGISPKILKECALTLCYPLAMIFNKSMTEMKLPADWKQANINPLFKGGVRTEPGNYRPVSLTSVPGKVMERLVIEQVRANLKMVGIPNTCQHGFVTGRSCLTNLLVSLEEWSKALDEGGNVDVVYLDISKAFDTVPHKRLTAKMKRYGLGGNLLGWLVNFLSDRQMRVGVHGEFSDWTNVTSSVPQGTIGGPTQFGLYVHDMPEFVVNRIIQFADDTKLWRIIQGETDKLALQADLDSLGDWSEEWMLRFNPKKCKVLHLGSRNPEFVYTMKDGGSRIKLETTSLEKDLGVLITDNLKVGEQCERAAGKAMRVLGMIRRSFTKLDEETLKTLYCSFVRPHLEYCIHAWSPYFKKDIEVLEKVQKRATKLLPWLRNLSYEDRLLRLDMPSLEQRRLRGDLIETYKILTRKEDLDPEIFFKYSTTGNLRGSNSMKLFKPRTKMKVRQNFFSQRVIDYWNALPEYVVKAPSTNSFKARLDKHWKAKKWDDIKANRR